MRNAIHQAFRGYEISFHLAFLIHKIKRFLVLVLVREDFQLRLVLLGPILIHGLGWE